MYSISSFAFRESSSCFGYINILARLGLCVCACVCAFVDDEVVVAVVVAVVAVSGKGGRVKNKKWY